MELVVLPFGTHNKQAVNQMQVLLVEQDQNLLAPSTICLLACQTMSGPMLS